MSLNKSGSIHNWHECVAHFLSMLLSSSCSANPYDHVHISLWPLDVRETFRFGFRWFYQEHIEQHYSTTPGCSGGTVEKENTSKGQNFEESNLNCFIFHFLVSTFPERLKDP